MKLTEKQLTKRKATHELKSSLNTLQDFQKFINDNKIYSCQNLKDLHPTVYKWLRQTKFNKDIIYYGQTNAVREKEEWKNYVIENFNTLEDFQNYIDENQIDSTEEIKKGKNYIIYQRLKEFGFNTKVVYKNSKPSHISEIFKKYKTLEDFQNFIDTEKITSSKDMANRFGNSIYNLLISLGYNRYVIYYGRKHPQIKPMSASEEEIKEIQNIIDKNKITNYRELRRKIGSKNYKLKITNKGILPPWITYYGKKKKDIFNPSDFETFEKAQEYITKNKVRKIEDLPNNIITLLRAKNFTKQLILFSDKSLPTTLEEFDNFIIETKITGSADFSARFPKEYRRLTTLRIVPSKYWGRVKHTPFTELEQFQKLIDQEVIRNPTDFSIRFPGVYQRLCNFGFASSVRYHGKIKQSNLEYEVETLLENKGINIIVRRKQDFLTNNKSLDVFIPDYRIAIECQGDQHYMSIEQYGGDEGLKRRMNNDRDKYNECKKEGVVLLYYSNPLYMKRMYREKIINDLIPNYIDKVYLNINELWTKISELIEERSQGIK